MTVIIDERYVGTQSAHRGWVVQVLKSTARNVLFIVKAGPGRSCKKHQWMSLDIFLINFEVA